ERRVHSAGDGGRVRAQVGERGAGREAADDAQEAAGPVLRAELVGGERQRAPGVEALRKLQLVGEHADDPERSAGDLDCLSDHGWIAAETALPERVTEDRDAGVPGFLLVTREPPAERGLHAEHRKERAGRAAETDVLRRVGAGEA